MLNLDLNKKQSELWPFSGALMSHECTSYPKPSVSLSFLKKCPHLMCTNMQNMDLLSAKMAEGGMLVRSQLLVRSTNS